MKIPALLAALVVGSIAGLTPLTAMPMLEKGMDETAIRQIAGTPAEIQAIKDSDVKAEKWIYRRLARRGVVQTANMQGSVYTFAGVDMNGPAMTNAVVPVYKIKYVETYQVTALLMVEGKLQAGKQWFERKEEFAN